MLRSRRNTQRGDIEYMPDVFEKTTEGQQVRLNVANFDMLSGLVSHAVSSNFSCNRSRQTLIAPLTGLTLDSEEARTLS